MALPGLCVEAYVVDGLAAEADVRWLMTSSSAIDHKRCELWTADSQTLSGVRNLRGV